MAPRGSSAVLLAVAAILLLGAATPNPAGEPAAPEETAVPQYPSCPSTGSAYGQAAAADGESAFGVCPAGEDAESGDGDHLPPLRLRLNFTVAEPSTGGGGGSPRFPHTPAGSAQSSQPGPTAKGSVSPRIPSEFSTEAEAAAAALEPSSSGRASRKGALTVAPPLAGEAVVRMDAPGQAVAPVSGTDAVFFPILPPAPRPPPDPPPFQLSVEKVEGEVLGKVTGEGR